jgi:tetratricopeptide (TPR) repeat protein
MRAIPILLCCFYFTNLFALSETEKDSLTIVVNKIPSDTGKINFLLRLSAQLKQSNPQQAREYAFDALNRSIKVNDMRGEIRSYDNIGDAYFVSQIFDSASFYYYQLLPLAETIRDTPTIAKSYYNFGKIFWKQGKTTGDTLFFGNALKNYQTALKLRIILGDKAGIGACLNAIGVIFDEFGNRVKNQTKLDSALAYYKQALSFREATRDSNGLAITLLNIGALYGDIGLIVGDKYFHEQELIYHRRALDIFRVLGNKERLVTMYINIGKTYIKLDRPQDAIPQLDSGIALAKSFSPILYEVLDDLYEARAIAYEKNGNLKQKNSSRRQSAKQKKQQNRD